MRLASSTLVLFLVMGVAADSKAWEGDKRAPWVGTMLNGTKCDGGQVAFGPYDYLLRDSLQAQLEVVEESHFNRDVENLTKGMSASAMGDIHYTLQAWPNHHRALNSAFRFRLQHRELWNSGENTAQNYPAECYLQRAMNFSPNDPIPYMLHGMLMHQMKQYDAALESYRHAIRLRPDDLITQYNMGLTLVELKKIPEAQKIADKVYAADFPLPGLQRKLAEAKKQAKTPRTPPKTGAAATAAAGATAPAAQQGQKPSPSVAPDNKSQEKDVSVNAAVDASVSKAAVQGTLPAAAAVQAPSSKDAPATGIPATSTTQSASAAAAADTPPKLTPEQQAILKQALIDQAAKKSQEPASAEASK